MRYLICPDSFKGSLTAAEAAEAMWQGVAEADPEAEVIVMPMADGGEGTAGILASALGGCRIRCEVCSADRRKIEASYYMVNERLLPVGSLTLPEPFGVQPTKSASKS